MASVAPTPASGTTAPRAGRVAHACALPRAMGKVIGDFHVHTTVSGDGRSTLEEVVATAKGRGYRVLAIICILGCVFLVAIGVQPPNDRALWILVGSFALAAFFWVAVMRRHFAGPPRDIFVEQRHAEPFAANTGLTHADSKQTP